MRPSALFVSIVVALSAGAGVYADTHHFAPGVFYMTFSGAHAPALRIKSGDRVITTTLDDVGVGADGRRVAEGSHPQTGPFYVEGADPGDLLVVTIEKLEVNRTTGASTSFMAPSAVTPGALSRPDSARVPWTVDTPNGVVRFDLETAIPNTEWRARFSSPTFEMPLRPMLGSVAVAPPGAPSASTSSGPFGGNMVFAGIRAGSRVMLPVFQPGALLFLGHGHARQAHGVVAMAGVEISMDVEFSVEVVKRKTWPHSSVVRPSTVVGEFEMGWPRIETTEYLMTVGTAPSLLQALQNATLELHHWLDDDFGLSEKTVNIFMGQATEYEIGSVVEPNYTVAAKVRKAYLPTPVAPAP